MKTKSMSLFSSRPATTLFALVSVDGKISTGMTDELDFDKDLPTIGGVKEGLQQYYDIEKTTDIWSLGSGKTQAKLGVNENPNPPKMPVSFVLVDNHNLTEIGVQHFCKRSEQFVLVTTNSNHPAFTVNAKNLHTILQPALDLGSVLERLYKEYGCKRITVQTGGTLNSILLREKLLDYVDVVIAPALIGGKDTTTLIDGQSLTRADQLPDLAVLKLESVQPLKDSYVRLRYRVIHH